ncbi:16S rRNA (guanine(1207)-N(2))-methyltransferase RsmC [Oceanisphaera arctica]|uniref:Ribosomal RNA small subunit methyltransferase C n=1 Tax=Oceanisphaera arctica TaxID=641510 RepID=A0A2P5TNF7_9GAMM|nr:16S rRNA (guanine(1207)-N(2))-methyltransferase RsmC [Oceanisphaera arctica]PPL17114.1 rRNA methyltransferase [Oceanisphaera arctica]GHA04355.1 ribosomal RNA small subunit methyltransferase C [Oceanisphaera arctica]
MFEALTPVSEMLTRNLDILSRQPLLVCGLLEDNLPGLLAEAGPAPRVFTTDFRYFQWQQAQGLTDIEFGTSPGPSAAAGLLLLMPKAKAEAEYLLAACLPLLAAGAPVFIAGDNKGGVKSAPKLLAPYCGQVNKLDSARRASLYQAELTTLPAPFALADWISRYPLEEEQLQICALPGVFSAAHLDSGSRLLLKTISSLKGRVLDFGCGAGVIGASLLKRHPELTLECIDINALALEASRATLAENQLDAKVYASDGLKQVSGKFNHIITNPPFHAGLRTFYHTTETLLSSAADYLVPGGSLILVANAFLPYPELIEKSFGHCETLAATGKFRIYRARR